MNWALFLLKKSSWTSNTTYRLSWFKIFLEHFFRNCLNSESTSHIREPVLYGIVTVFQICFAFTALRFIISMDWKLPSLSLFPYISCVLFDIFSLSLILCNLILRHLSVHFFLFLVLHVGSVSWISVFIVFMKFGKKLVIISSDTSSVLPSF